MDEMTDRIGVAFLYHVIGRKPQCPVRSHLVSEVEHVRFKVVAAEQAKLVAGVGCDLEGHELRLAKKSTKKKTRFRRTFDYRMIDGRLMRQMRSPFLGLAPLTLDLLAAKGGDVASRKLDTMAEWIDCPSPLPAEPSHLTVTERETSGIRDFVEDGRDSAWSALMGLVGEMRVVDGVLYKPAPPPAWAVSFDRYGHRLTPTPFVPDYDIKEYRRLGFDVLKAQDVSYLDMEDRVGVADPRVALRDLVSRIAEQGGTAYSDLYRRPSIEVFDPDFFEVGHYDFYNRALLDLRFRECAVDELCVGSPRARLAVDGLLAALAAEAAGGVDRNVAQAAIIRACDAIAHLEFETLFTSTAIRFMARVRMAVHEAEAALDIGKDVEDDDDLMAGLGP